MTHRAPLDTAKSGIVKTADSSTAGDSPFRKKKGNRRDQLEAELQRQIEAAIGAEPDLLLMKNSVGNARYTTADGKVFHVPYGLGTGSPDLVGILAPTGRWFALEVKCPGEKPTPEQLAMHVLWRRFGAYVEVVTSVDEAKAALREARGRAAA